VSGCERSGRLGRGGRSWCDRRGRGRRAGGGEVVLDGDGERGEVLVADDLAELALDRILDGEW